MNKLTKEECCKLKSVKEKEYRAMLKYINICNPTARKMFEMLIDEHFELKEKYSKILDDVHDYRHEIHSMKMTIRNLCEHFGMKDEKELKNIYLCQPYKFEDLKVGMWVWCEVKNHFTYRYRGWALIEKIDDKIHCKTLDGDWQFMFEENRFYPIQKSE